MELGSNKFVRVRRPTGGATLVLDTVMTVYAVVFSCRVRAIDKKYFSSLDICSTKFAIDFAL